MNDADNLKASADFRKRAAAALKKVQDKQKRKGKKRKATHEIIYWKHNSVVIDGWNPVANAKKPSH